MTPGGDLILGYDFGTSSVKSALFDAEGRVAARARESYPLFQPEPGWAEQRPDDWWEAMARASRRMLAEAEIAPDSVAAVAIAAQMGGVVAVDEAGAALQDAMIWLDTRSAGQARRLMAGWPRIHGYGVFALLSWLRLTNGAPNLSGKDPLSKMLWLRDEQAALWARARRLPDVKEYLLHRATGEWATTPDCAHLTWLMDARPGRWEWSEALLRRVGLDRARLSEIRPAAEFVGGLRPEAADDLGLRAGTPMVAGAGDVLASALGAGVRATEALYLYLGTSSWWGAHRDRPKVDVARGIGTLAAAERDRYLLVATQESAGAAVAWAANALGFGGNLAAFDAAAREAGSGPDGPLFLPWLQGERVPVDDPDLRAGFIGLALSSGRGELARAVLEGVALNARWALEAMEKSLRAAPSTARIVGGGAVSDLWCRIIADVTGLALARTAEPDLAGARGVAMLAAVALGWSSDLAAAGAMTREAERYQPDPSQAARYDMRYRRFLEVARSGRRWRGPGAS